MIGLLSNILYHTRSAFYIYNYFILLHYGEINKYKTSLDDLMYLRETALISMLFQYRNCKKKNFSIKDMNSKLREDVLSMLEISLWKTFGHSISSGGSGGAPGPSPPPLPICVRLITYSSPLLIDYERRINYCEAVSDGLVRFTTWQLWSHQLQARNHGCVCHANYAHGPMQLFDPLISKLPRFAREGAHPLPHPLTLYYELLLITVPPPPPPPWLFAAGQKVDN